MDRLNCHDDVTRGIQITSETTSCVQIPLLHRWRRHRHISWAKEKLRPINKWILTPTWLPVKNGSIHSQLERQSVFLSRFSQALKGEQLWGNQNTIRPHLAAHFQRTTWPAWQLMHLSCKITPWSRKRTTFQRLSGHAWMVLVFCIHVCPVLEADDLKNKHSALV